MKKIVFIIVILITSSFSNKQTKENIWLKTYQNYKNYNIIISNISKTQINIKKNTSNQQLQEQYRKKLSIYNSKLALYEKNNNFDNILLKYKFETSDISLREFVLKNSLDKLNKLIEKFQVSKNQFYLAKSTLQNNYNTLIKENPKDKKALSLKEDIDYFTEYEESIEKTHQNLLETKDELLKKYDEYKDEVFTKHLFTMLLIFIFYIFYKAIHLLFCKTKNLSRYTKPLSVVFYIFICLFLTIRYIDDVLYLITFLSVVAAALTIATREIILNIAGGIYIFFSRVIKIGDRVMVQFETKHTIGDVVNISILKIKLNEIDDYSNLKEIKSVGRTIYIPNSYIFTKVFYNYSQKEKGIINDLIELDFEIDNDFKIIEELIDQLLKEKNINFRLSFSLNSLKTAITANISYESNFKESAKKRGELSILLMQELKKHKNIKLKSTKRVTKTTSDENE